MPAKMGSFAATTKQFLIVTKHTLYV